VLFGAIAAQMGEGVLTNASESDTALYLRAVAAGRATLGKEAYEAAFAAGKAPPGRSSSRWQNSSRSRLALS